VGIKLKRSSRKLIINVAGISLAFGLLGWTIAKNWTVIQQVFQGPLDGRLFALAFAVNMLAVVLTFVRWYILVRALDIPFRLRDAVRLGFIGNVFNLVIPGAVGGDLIKAVYLCQEQSRKAEAVASMVIDRIVGLLGLFLLAAVMGAWIWRDASGDVQRLIMVVWVAVVAGLLGLAVLFTPALYQPLARLFARRKRLARIFQELSAAAGAYRTRLGVVALMLLMAMGIHSLYVLSFYMVSRAMFPTIPSLGEHFLMVPLTLFTTAVPLPFGALGLSEKISDQLFRLVNHPSGAVAMMGYRVLMYAGGVVSAFVYLANLRQVRTLSQQVEQEGPSSGDQEPLEAVEGDGDDNRMASRAEVLPTPNESPVRSD
jgi:glycosyltransferase 2 family protein